jgi:SNF2 family DNA or RNA helicase
MIEYKFYNHQLQSVDFHISRSYSADFSQQGTGKTLTAIEVIRRRIKRGLVSKTLVACPASVIFVWEEETRKFSNLKSIVLQGSGRETILNKNYDVFIISYDSIHPILGNLLNVGFDMLICDESSRIKNPLAKRTESILRLAGVIPYRMILSATPIPNNLMDVWSQFMVLDGGKTFSDNFYKFRAINFVPYKWTGFTEWEPKKEFEGRLKQEIKANSVRYLRKDCLDLPPKVYQKLHTKLVGVQKKKYEAIASQLPIEEFDFELPNSKLTEYAKLSQLTGGFLYLDDGRILRVETEKTKVVGDLVEDLVNDNEKVIIYYVYEEERIIYQELLKEYNPLLLSGKISAHHKQQACNLFQTDDNRKVILIQVHCGIGITLTAATSVIYVSNNFNYEDREQSEDRAYRAGQTKTVTIIDIITKGTLDEKVLQVLNKKRGIASYLLGDI